MRKIILSLTKLFVASTCYGAISNDASQYMRKDVFEAYIQSINAKLDIIIQEQKSQREELKEQRKDINELTQAITALSERLDGNVLTLSARINSIDALMGDIRNDIYLGLVILGIIVSLPTVQKMLENREKHKNTQPALTLEDVQKLIDENPKGLKHNG